MQSMRPLTNVSDDELLRRLAVLVRESRHTEAELVAHIGEVDARRLYAREAVPSMFQYCTERLHLSGAEAYLRIAAARAARDHPVILSMLADGRLHLTAVAMLAPHLTPENRDVLLLRATHRTKRAIEELLAELAPRPDAPTLVRRLPEKRASAVPSPARLPVAPVTSASTSAASAEDSRAPVSILATAMPPLHVAPSTKELRLDGVVSRRSSDTVAQCWRVEPLSLARYKVQFTASAELREKLERLRDLMRASVPDGDLVKIIDAAVTEKLDRLERRRFGLAKAPRVAAPRVDESDHPKDSPSPHQAADDVTPGPMAADPMATDPTSGGLVTAGPVTSGLALTRTDPPPHSRHVPAEVRRAVYERGGARCCFVDEQGRRCTARAWLQFHHRHPFALGGEHSPATVSVLCHAHNRCMAVVDFGRETMDRYSRKGASS